MEFWRKRGIGFAGCCAAACESLQYVRNMPAALKQYEAELDDQKRITIQGSKFRKFVVTHEKNGYIILQPRAGRTSSRLSIVSTRTLNMMDAAMANFRKGKVSKAIALTAEVAEE